MGGTGTLILNNNNSSYAGTTTVNQGTLEASNAGAFGSGAVNITPTTTNGATLLLNASAINNAINFTSVAGQNAALTVSGAGPYTLGGAIGLSGTNNTINISTSSDVVTLSSAITGSGGGFTLAGPGILKLSATGNTYSGLTTISGGTLELGVASSAPSSSIIDLTGGTFSLNGFAGSIAGLEGTSGTVTLGGNVLTTNDSGSDTYSGAITSTVGGGLTMAGTGTLNLNNNNSSYTGTTTVNQGTLEASNAGAFGSGAVNITPTTTNGATLLLNSCRRITMLSTSLLSQDKMQP